MTNGRKEKLQALESQNEQKRLSKEQLLQPHIREVEVEIAELGGTVLIRTLSHRVRQELRQKCGFGTPEFDEDKFTNLGIIYSVVDPELTEEDLESLKELSANVYDELVTQISMVNLFGAGAELKKDSSPTQS